MIWRQLLILSLEKFSEIGKVIVTSSVSKLVMISSGLLVRGSVIHFENYFLSEMVIRLQMDFAVKREKK